jgi:hypothetical protein
VSLSPSPSNPRDTSVHKSPTAPQAPLPSMNLAHLELMHHYLTSTSITLEQPGKNGQMWRNVAPVQALNNEFLMHAVLGVSALHIVHLRGSSDTRQEYIARARTHQQEALTHFRSTVRNITPGNSTAAALFSSLLLIFSSAITQIIDEPIPSHDHVDGLLTILLSFRKHWNLFFSTREWIEEEAVENLPLHLETVSPEEINLTLHNYSGASHALQDLYDFNELSFCESVERSVYCNAIMQIQRSLQGSAVLSRILWPIVISDEFLLLLEQKQPMALIILAHGCAIARFGPYRWFLHKWIVNVARAISEILDPIWLVRLRWPLRELGLLLDDKIEN